MCVIVGETLIKTEDDDDDDDGRGKYRTNVNNFFFQFSLMRLCLDQVDAVRRFSDFNFELINVLQRELSRRIWAPDAFTHSHRRERVSERGVATQQSIAQSSHIQLNFIFFVFASQSGGVE